MHPTESVVTLGGPGERKVAEDRAFFCSELIAKCYKDCGIMQSHLHSASFNPGNFSTKGQNLNLVEGVTLGTEKLVITQN